MAGTHKGILEPKIAPAFLKANAGSHIWSFSAIAELIDNAYDPDVAATQLNIDVEEILGVKCLVFLDNGNGMTADKLHKMLSFGFCEKVEVKGHKPVGHYGNGFKSGSMRLAKDALVFTKCAECLTVGFLSQTYLADIEAETILVPIISWNAKTKTIIKGDCVHDDSLADILKYSLFHSESRLKLEFNDLSRYKSGTRIVLYNLAKSNDDKFELDFQSDSKDIINSERQELDFSTTLRPVMDHVPEYRRSLREYCSILFLKPKMKIILRNHKVMTKLISRSLSKTEKDFYRPQYLGNMHKPLKIIFGFSKSDKDYGMMLYHHNRLIKAFEHVGCQKQNKDQGVGVVGVVEVDFLQPIHNKQDFNTNARYNACINALGQKLNEYWYTKSENNYRLDIECRLKADWTWAQCDTCLKWRRLPDGFTDEGLPDKWFCYNNRDPTHNRCDIEEDLAEDEDELKQVKKRPKDNRRKSLVEKEQQLLRKSLEKGSTTSAMDVTQRPSSTSNSRDNLTALGATLPQQIQQQTQLEQNLLSPQKAVRFCVPPGTVDTDLLNTIIKAPVKTGTTPRKRPGELSTSPHNKKSGKQSQTASQQTQVDMPCTCKRIKESDLEISDPQPSSSMDVDPVLETPQPTASTCSTDQKYNTELLIAKLEVTQSQLNCFRNNVSKLLQTILPEEADNLDSTCIERVVREMIKNKLELLRP